MRSLFTNKRIHLLEEELTLINEVMLSKQFVVFDLFIFTLFLTTMISPFIPNLWFVIFIFMFIYIFHITLFWILCKKTKNH